MNKLKSLGMAIAIGGGLMASAYAADTSATINVRRPVQPVGMSPQIGVVRATATTTPTFTVDLPLPSGKTANDILEFQGTVYDPSGTVKLVNIIRSGRTVTVTSGVGVSTSAVGVGDVLRGIVSYK